MPTSHAALIPLCYVGYGLASRGLTPLRAGRAKEFLFAFLNLSAVFLVYFALPDPRFAVVFAVYLGAVCGCYALMRLFASRARWTPWAAFAAPILLLIGVRWVPVGLLASHSAALAEKLAREPTWSITSYFVGLSYLAFRCSRLVIEVRNRSAPMPGLFRYLGFAFFFPVMPVGPIHSLSQHIAGLEGSSAPIPVNRCLGRVSVGLAKYFFLGGLFNQLAYFQLLLDGRLHSWLELPVACTSYYLFLYMNFSGCCDMAIGLAGLAGIPVPENFNAPMGARNLRDFWNRWHITLSEYMRDIVFAPLSKRLVVLFGPRRAPHAIAVAIVVVFLLIGIWHGVGWNYAAFGLVHAAGVVANHYYGLFLKRHLSPPAWRAYQASPGIRWAGTAATFLYVAASLFFFANSFAEMREIFHVLR